MRHEDLKPLEDLFAHAYPQTLRDLATSMFMEMLERSADLPAHPARPGLLARLALDLANRLSRDFGGNGLYIHKAVRFHLSQRNWEMFAMYDNQRWTYKSLGIKYDLSEVQVRNIIQACLDEEVARRQGRLPGLDDPQED